MKLKSFKPIGSSPIELQKVNLIVGPNNSGKSQLLSDIQSQIIDTNSKTVIIEKLNINDFSFPETYGDATSDLKIREHPDISGIRKIFFYDSSTRGLNNFEKTKIDLDKCKDSYNHKDKDCFLTTSNELEFYY